MNQSTYTSLPTKASIGLRQPHYQHVLKNTPPLPWFEIHSENFFAKGGINHHILEKLCEHYPMSFHGVGLSLGSAAGLDKTHLTQLRDLIDRYKPAAISEHVSWSHNGNHFLNDLLPLPYNDEAAAILVGHICEVQDALGCKILIENPSTYLEFTTSSMPEYEFVAKVVDESQCGLLLDVNNIIVGKLNHGLDSNAYLDTIDPTTVGEIHLAGHLKKELNGKPIHIDHHGSDVPSIVWKLYQQAIALTGPIPTLIERDTNIPEFDSLVSEANRAQTIMDNISKAA